MSERFPPPPVVVAFVWLPRPPRLGNGLGSLSVGIHNAEPVVNTSAPVDAFDQRSTMMERHG